ncbi:MAG: LacI family DNA-binding transcriptional regulator [Cryobacterium sp.]|nr:LacI family DNA-binding transcriptional regulator [Cryobacterium sp.]
MTEVSEPERERVPPRTAPSPRKAAPTIYDIARLAGVNPSTVSRALSKPGRINVETEKRVKAAAEELGYRVNPMARALPTGRTQTIGMIVADITNPVIFDTVRGAERTAAAHDYTLVLAESVESAENELRAAERLLPVVDGVILGTSRLRDEEIVHLAERKPVVVINRSVEGVASVIADIEQGIVEAVRHVASLGHRSVVYVAGPARSWMSQRRWECLSDSCESLRIALQRVEAGTPTVDGGRRAAVAVRESGASVAFAYNDLMAIGLMQELQLAGISVPGELSIVGFDNIFGSDFTTPTLTTIGSPLSELGARASTLIIDVVMGDGSSREATDGAALATRLVVRGSTGAPRALYGN